MRDKSSRSKETDPKECASSQGPIVRKDTPTPHEQQEIPESIDVVFSEDGQGVKHLAKPSNGTATLVYFVFPNLETAARHAMETVQQLRENRITVPTNVLLQEHPILAKWGNRKEIQEVINSNPGCPEAQKMGDPNHVELWQEPPAMPGSTGTLRSKLRRVVQQSCPQAS